MANTANYGFPKPDTAKNIDEEFYVFRDTTLDMIDAAIKAVSDAAALKSPIGHGHAIADIAGLAGELAGKMSASTTFSLDSLTDVDGATGAAVNNVLVKNSSGQWVPSSALAALGPHGHTIAEITGLSDVLVSKADGAAVASALGLKAEKAVTVTGAGLASGGGDLSANRVITVTKATDAEHEARVRDDVAATPKGVGLALVAYNRWKRIGVVRTSGTAFVHTNLSEFSRIKIEGGFRSVSAAGAPGLQVSADNGASWSIASSTYEQLYSYHVTGGGGTAGGGTSSNTMLQFLAGGNQLSTSRFSRFSLDIAQFNVALPTSFLALFIAHISSGAYISGENSGHQTASVAMNALRFTGSQSMDADYELVGLPT